MGRLAYVNGRFVPHGKGTVHIEDRGFQFGDGVYEVVTIVNGRLVDQDGHLDRLKRSLEELRIDWPVSRRALDLLMRQLVRRNGVRDGIIYLQVTRGAASRDFKFPKDAKPSLVMTTRRMRFPTAADLDGGVKVVTLPDIRWKRRDIKSVCLLPQVLGKQWAAEQGAFEGWQVDDDGLITEGCSSNAWIVSGAGVLLTRQATADILKGITRCTVMALAKEADLPVEVRPFSVEEAYDAREAFVTSATTFVTPVTQIDDRQIADGKPGRFSRELRRRYMAFAEGLRDGKPLPLWDEAA